METGTKVTIFGRSYTIKGDADPDHIREIADYVDNKMREISARAPTISSSKLAILAALNIAEDLYQLREQEKAKKHYIEQKTTALLSLLDERL
ncbi:MAG: cell division protein ZapA [Candidatus Tectomicrobia bacterium]|nr:cell division protein ZapA [Candidatus Tectomicrobia bacterium]